MSRISKDCIDEALRGLINFSKDDLEQYVRNIFEKARSYDDLLSQESFNKAIEEVNDELNKQFFDDAQTKANNIRKYNERKEAIESGRADLKSLIIKRYNNLGDNIVSFQKAELTNLDSFVFGDMNEDEVDFMTNSKNDQVICDAFDGRQVNDPLAKRWGKKIKDYFDKRNSEMLISNAMNFEEMRKDRWFKAVHDASKLIHGKKSLARSAQDEFLKKYETSDSKGLWKEFIKSKIDLYETFKKTKAYNIETGQLDDDIVDGMLDNIYNNITTGKSEIFTQSEVANDRDAVKRKSNMFFVWKSMRDLYDYNNAYGDGKLFTMLRRDMHASSTKIGTAKAFGDNPYSTYNDLRKVQEKVNPKGKLFYHTSDLYLKQALGIDQQAVSPSLAKLTDNIKTLSTMSRLVTLAVQSVPDIGSTMAPFAMRMGNSYFKAFFTHLSHLFDTFPNEERKRIAKLMKTQIDSHIGYVGRWTDINNSSEFLNKVSTGFFKNTFLTAFDRGNKISTMHLMAEHLYNNSGKSFNTMNPYLKKWVSKFMNADEWNLLRKKNQGKLFTIDNATNLTDDELKEYQDKYATNKPLYELRDDLFRKVHAMFDVASENAVLSPGEFEKAWLYQGTKPGTPIGSFARLVTQFKMYGLSYIDRVLVGGWKDADTPQRKLMWGLSLLIGTLPLSMLSTYFNNYAVNGESTDFSDPDYWNPDNTITTLAPSLAVYAGIVDPNNQNSNMAFSLLASPSTRLISDSMASIFSLADADPERAKKNFINAMGYMLPINTAPALTPFLNAALDKKSYPQPGTTKIYGA